MSRRWLMLAGVLASCGVGSVPVAAKEPATPRWLSDWEEGRKAARAAKRPIFVVFRCEH